MPARAAPAIIQVKHNFFMSTNRNSPLIASNAQSGRLHLTRKISGKITGVALLQVRALPIFAGESPSAIRPTAIAFNGIIVVIRHGPIVCQLLTSATVTHGYEGDLTAQSQIRIA